MYGRRARQLPFVEHVVCEFQRIVFRIVFRACDFAVYIREFAFRVAHCAAVKFITRNVDVEGNFVVAYRHIAGLRIARACDVCARNNSVKRSDECNVGSFFVDQVDLDRRATLCVAPITRLEVIARVGCKVDRVDAVPSAVLFVRLLIYATGVVVDVRKFCFEFGEFRFVACIFSQICRDVANRFVVEEVYGLYGLLLDVESERYLLRRIDRLATLVLLACVDKSEFRAAFRAVHSCVRFYLRVNRTAVKDVLLRFEFRASGVGVILHRRPVGEHLVRILADGNVELVVSLVPRRIESVVVFDAYRHRRGFDRVHFDGNVNLLLAAVFSADDEFRIERICSLIAVSLVGDFVGREFVHRIIVCVEIGFARFDERRFDAESVADRQVFHSRVSACVFDVDSE